MAIRRQAAVERKTLNEGEGEKKTQTFKNTFQILWLPCDHEDHENYTYTAVLTIPTNKCTFITTQSSHTTLFFTRLQLP